MADIPMELNRMANILTNKTMCFDYADYIEDYEENIALVQKELQLLVDNNCDGLLMILGNFAYEHEDMEDWIKTTDAWKERVEEKMMAYCQIVNMIDNIAKHGRAATTSEMIDIKSMAEEYRIDVESFADANDCGKCFTWEEVIGAFRCLWASGERI